MARDVIEHIVDGTSGLATGSVGGCIVVGVCSKSEELAGKTFLLGNRSDIEDTLGVGVLSTRIKDIMMTGGQNPLVIAVPVKGSITGEVSSVMHTQTDENSATSPSVTVSGVSQAANDYSIAIVSSGDLNEGTYQLSVNSKAGAVQTIPVDGVIKRDGLSITFPAGSYLGNDLFTFNTTAPQATIVDVMEAIEAPLDTYDVEFVYIAGESDSVAWTAAQAKAESLFNLHRPTYFKMEAALPNAQNKEGINAWTTDLVNEAKNFTGRWVQVCAQYGAITDSDGKTQVRNWAGLQAGRTMAIPVHRAHGRVLDGGISQGSLPAEGESAIQSTLEKAGYLTAKRYAGMSGAYWGDSRTMADSTSDYQYEEVVRTMFKGLRLSRRAALKSMYNELGDPMNPADMTGAVYLQTNIEVALDTMTKAAPTELADYQVVIPPGQDFLNNGVAVEITLIGIPIIRKIQLFANYTYAGTRFDPRLTEK